MILLLFLILVLPLVEYEQMMNESLAPTTAACEEFIRLMDDVVCIDGRYHSTSTKSEHIRQLIRNQSQILRMPARIPHFPGHHRIPPNWQRM